MPRYFFDIDDGVHIRDHEGVTLSGLFEIEIIAGRAIAELVRDKRLSAFAKPLTLTVRDEAGQSIYCAKMTVESAWHGEPGG